MAQKKKKILSIAAVLIIAGLLVGGGIGLYMFNMPHRDVQDSSSDFSLTSTQLVNEYFTNSAEANDKYLAEDGESKILEITGTVESVGENYNDQKVVLLKETNDKAGVSCIFIAESGSKAAKLKPGETITIKGVIRSGAAYDEDLGLYEHVILDKSDIVSGKK
ncbi:MAG: hypothetical protein U9R19_09855 [Bacteroidota bacterium]|nr:hypothetical protein [Bacteroidota bacterium]